MNAEFKKFNNYKDCILFAQNLILNNPNKEILILGSDEFTNDILDIKYKNCQIEELESEFITDDDNDRPTRLNKTVYEYAIIHENFIKQLKRYKVSKMAYIISDIKKDYDNFNNECSCEDCMNCNNNELNDDVADIIEEYASIILANSEDVYDILEDLYYKSFNSGVIAGKCENLQLLTEDIQEDLANINDDFNDEYLN